LVGDVPGQEEEEQVDEPQVAAETLRQVLEQLPDHYRRVLTLRSWKGCLSKRLRLKWALPRVT